MHLHAEFLTDDVLRYAAECSHMASLARPVKRNRSRPAEPIRWADWADQIRSLYPQPQAAYPAPFAASPAMA